MNEKSKNILEVSSIIISVLALIISLLSFGYTVQKDMSDNSEQVNIINSEIGYNETVSYNMAGGYRGQGMISGVNYSFILSNNSKQKISIVSYDICQITGAENRFIYGNMVNSIKDNKNEKIMFPFSLDAGESLEIIVEINTLIPSSVNMLIANRYGVDANVNIKPTFLY